MFDEKRIFFIIPAFNEAARIASTIHALGEYANSKFKSFEIIVVSDGSTDSTSEIVAALCGGIENLKLINRSGNYGKGASIKKEFRNRLPI